MDWFRDSGAEESGELDRSRCRNEGPARCPKTPASSEVLASRQLMMKRWPKAVPAPFHGPSLQELLMGRDPAHPPAPPGIPCCFSREGPLLCPSSGHLLINRHPFPVAFSGLSARGTLGNLGAAGAAGAGDRGGFIRRGMQGKLRSTSAAQALPGPRSLPLFPHGHMPV